MPRITVRGPQGPPVSHRIDRETLTVGRAPTNDLVLADPALSRIHVDFHWDGSAWIVRDRASRNGSWLNGRPLKRPEPLSPGDQVRLGDTTLTFEEVPAGSVAEAADTETAPPGWSSRGSGTASSDTEIVGRSAALTRVWERIAAAARSPSTVLILGENGTGKELVAHRIHQLSSRSSAPFVVVNCPAIPPGLLEAELFGVEKGVATGVEPRLGRIECAERGTLFLDEIGDLDPAAQAKLLRFLQDRSIDRVGARAPRKVDVRLLAATNHDLEDAVAQGRFRRDLYHRLDVLSIRLPPLRERKDDIPLLAEHFLRRGQARPGLRLGAAALRALSGYDYPGNVRELEHALEGAAAFARGDEIALEDLPEAIRRGAGGAASHAPAADVPAALYARIVEARESFWTVVREPYLRRELSREDARAFVRRVHAEAGGSYKQAARLLGLEGEYKRFVNFLQNHGLRVG